MDKLTRLDKLLFRLEAQHACLAWAFAEIADRPGPVFELGLGHGRTYDHMRTHLPGRDIYVFDREVDCIADCTPPHDRLFLGDVRDTLTSAADRFTGKVVLIHADMGSYQKAQNVVMRRILGPLLPPLMAPGAILISDLSIEVVGATALPLPESAREGRYFLYRNKA